jgi:hypothetical protein
MSFQNKSLETTEETTDTFEFNFSLCHGEADDNVYDHSYGYCRICS